MLNNARKIFLERSLSPEVFGCIKYLDLDKEGPNRGTKNKQELMIRILNYAFQWKEGNYNEWISKLSTRLGLSKRTTQENYLDPLIKENIVGRAGHTVTFLGVPMEAEDG